MTDVGTETRVEICVDSLEGVMAAERGGADRAELCAALSEGGLTPGPGTIELAQQAASIELACMIRPRGGDFAYSRAEFACMQRDLAYVREQGLTCAVFGVLQPTGEIDRARTAELVAAARPLQVTFHRAFDFVPDPIAGLEVLIELGVERVLTSGQAARAADGTELLSELVQRSAGRIAVMAAGGVREANVAQLVRETGVPEVHFTAFRSSEPLVSFRASARKPGAPSLDARGAEAEAARRFTDPELVRDTIRALRGS